MSSVRTIKVAKLNIAMHAPHSPERYVSLFQEAYSLHLLVRMGELHGAMLGGLYPVNRECPENGLMGEIYRFVKLDPDEPWFNTETREAATVDEIRNIHIPRHLLPHLQTIPFAFNPTRHRLWFVSHDRKDNLGPSSAVSFFQSLFDHLLTIKEYPSVEVTAIPEANALDRMLSLPTLEKLIINLKRPNPDDGESDEERLLRRLTRQRAKSMKVELVASTNESIKPDSDTRMLAQVASENGDVSVVARDRAGLRIEESTQERPHIEPVLVDSNTELAIDVLRRLAGVG